MGVGVGVCGGGVCVCVCVNVLLYVYFSSQFVCICSIDRARQGILAQYSDTCAIHNCYVCKI